MDIILTAPENTYNMGQDVLADFWVNGKLIKVPYFVENITQDGSEFENVTILPK